MGKPADKPIETTRGDTASHEFTIKKNGVAVNITGFTFRLTVNTEKAPLNQDNEQFQSVGSITDAPNGVVEFPLTQPDADLAVGDYFYDIQQIDGGSKSLTIVKSTYKVTQDITKETS